MQLRKGDILIALKAINLTQGIGNRDRRVAAALLDHFNRKTGQCDPSIKRLSGLLGISERTVFRSLQRIEADRLFKRARHGGHINRNSYEPNWPRFREIGATARPQYDRARIRWRAFVCDRLRDPPHTSCVRSCHRDPSCQRRRTPMHRTGTDTLAERGPIIGIVTP